MIFIAKSLRISNICSKFAPQIENRNETNND